MLSKPLPLFCRNPCLAAPGGLLLRCTSHQGSVMYQIVHSLASRKVRLASAPPGTARGRCLFQ
jgi:hypothetical protein